MVVDRSAPDTGRMVDTAPETGGQAQPGATAELSRPSGRRPLQPLRRSRTDRAGIGLCGGLGQYFGIDPVIFRVLFVVLSFFGGIGIVAYLAGYALVPEEGAPESSADRLLVELRRRRLVPVAIALGLAAVILLWSPAFSWWVPTPWMAMTLALVGLLVYFAMRQRGAPPPPAPPTGPTVWPPPARPAAPAGERAADGDIAHHFVGTDVPPSSSPPSPSAEPRGRRRAASRPIRAFTWAALIVTWVVMALIDMATPVPLKVFAWTGLVIVLAGFVAGLLWRRPAWSLLVLLLPMIAAVALFGSSEARIHDGTGDKAWMPSTLTEVDDEYALAFGRITLDLTAPGLAAQLDGRSIRIDSGAGEIVIRVPADLDVDFHGEVRSGQIAALGREWDGWGVERTMRSQGPDGEGGGHVELDVELGSGVIRLERTSS